MHTYKHSHPGCCVHLWIYHVCTHINTLILGTVHTCPSLDHTCVCTHTLSSWLLCPSLDHTCVCTYKYSLQFPLAQAPMLGSQPCVVTCPHRATGTCTTSPALPCTVGGSMLPCIPHTVAWPLQALDCASYLHLCPCPCPVPGDLLMCPCGKLAEGGG